MADNAMNTKYNSPEGEYYRTYLTEQMESWRWRCRKAKFLLTVAPETLAERAALVEFIYEYSLTHRINAYKAVDRISDIFEEGRSEAGGTEETRELAQTYHTAHSSYWLRKTEKQFLKRWSNGLVLGAILLGGDIIVRGTHLFSRPYSMSFISLVMLVVLLVAFPLIFAWLTGPKLSSEERIVGWRIL